MKISQSQLGMFFRCPEQYRRRYIEGEIIPPGFAAHRGIGVHKAAERNYGQKVETHRDMPVDDIKDLAAAGFEAAVEKRGVLLTEDEQSKGKDTVKGKYLDQTVSLAKLYATETAPLYQPKIVEADITVELPGEHDLRGILDMVDTSGLIHDIKTSGKKWSQSQADKSLQGSIYWLCHKAATGKEPTGFQFDVLVNKKEAEYQQVKTMRDNADMRILLARTNAFLSALKSGIFMPADPGHWICGPNHCGYAKTCPYCKC